jgi:F-type H+-transporting ATPase subunit delta
LINAIIDDLEHLILDSKNTAKVILKVAHKQSEETINAIKSQIREILQKEIILEIITQPEIIGGFIAETKSLQIDGSVRNNLEKFKISMIK